MFHYRLFTRYIRIARNNNSTAVLERTDSAYKVGICSLGIARTVKINGSGNFNSNFLCRIGCSVFYKFISFGNYNCGFCAYRCGCDRSEIGEVDSYTVGSNRSYVCTAVKLNGCCAVKYCTRFLTLAVYNTFNGCIIYFNEGVPVKRAAGVTAIDTAEGTALYNDMAVLVYGAACRAAVNGKAVFTKLLARNIFTNDKFVTHSDKAGIAVSINVGNKDDIVYLRRTLESDRFSVRFVKDNLFLACFADDFNFMFHYRLFARYIRIARNNNRTAVLERTDSAYKVGIRALGIARTVKINGSGNFNRNFLHGIGCIVFHYLVAVCTNGSNCLSVFIGDGYSTAVCKVNGNGYGDFGNRAAVKVDGISCCGGV